ncbi:UDP-N-acetylmuramoyl-tripeptide--D-alanyl-D-alanine ligase [Chloropicon primus]|uniref:UDP-MurNAc-pentapeptide synthetase n=1 Tax=Chloropicon primus TaxID=1764295 RepID=A0A5B8MTP3_9CHLO|nr:UDP-N-acetylmuramoyl-tripeptide--D-alanyl-D-alanine ligase [Chloropicon primus]UPR03367.1 UDP-N-acetylmuramoyl-tripeptide--D-alanyl-D-alanine ligase [Chloropicon primus]|eukprot:QDZ24158.1 UDP-N-acetylmuramoyl-tripeptide--D-alanyl-D-alanine ligase [Chloropicon primus]
MAGAGGCLLRFGREGVPRREVRGRPQREAGGRKVLAKADGLERGAVVFTSEEIAEATGGRVERGGEPGVIITDSRGARAGTWFLGIRGDRYDGRDFALDALARGCAGVVLETESEAEIQEFVSSMGDGANAGLVSVAGSSGGLATLHDLARSVRREYPGKVVGITGSCGKTTTRSMVSHLLRGMRGEGAVHETEGNNNNLIGVPLTILKLPSEAGFCVLELGMDRFGEIRQLGSICEPGVRVVTNVGLAHLEGVGGTIEGVADAKAELLEGARPGDVCVLNADDAHVSKMAPPRGVDRISFGRGEHCDVRILGSRASGEDGMRSRLTFSVRGKGEVLCEVCQPGHRNVAENAAAAVATLLALEVDFDLPTLRRGLSTFSSPLQVGRGRAREYFFQGRAIAVIDETYNSNPTSLLAALDTLCESGGEGSRRHAVLGDMLELGEASDHHHSVVLSRCLSDETIDTVTLVGDRFGDALERMRAEEGKSSAGERSVRWFSDPIEAASVVVAHCEDGDVVLVKGSRGMAMEGFFHSSVGLIGGL